MQTSSSASLRHAQQSCPKSPCSISSDWVWHKFKVATSLQAREQTLTGHIGMFCLVHEIRYSKVEQAQTCMCTNIESEKCISNRLAWCTRVLSSGRILSQSRAARPSLDWLLLFGVPVPIAGLLNAACGIEKYSDERQLQQVCARQCVCPLQGSSRPRTPLGSLQFKWILMGNAL